METASTPALILPQTFVLTGELVKTFKAENGWQGQAGLYHITTNGDMLGLPRFELVEGNPEPGWCNNTDLDRLLQTYTHATSAYHKAFYNDPWVVMSVKHGNPCGVGLGRDQVTAIRKMVTGNPQALFGGVVVLNFDFTAEHAAAFVEQDKLDMVIAPSFTEDGRAGLRRKNEKCRFVTNSALGWSRPQLDKAWRIRSVRGGFMVESNYTNILDLHSPDIIKYGEATPEQERDLLVAWSICATSNSNTITIVKDEMLIGNGVAQTSRVMAAEVAVLSARKLGHNIEGAVAVSDSFFPFNDGIEVLIDAGVKTIFATHKSQNDKNAIALCKERGVTLYTMHDDIARMFFGH